METQVDYEAAVDVGLFRSAEAASAAERRLVAAGIGASVSPLAPGRYQVADPRLGSRFRAGIGAAVVGAVVGAIVGALIGIVFFHADVAITFWLAFAGAGGCAILGPLYGIGRVSRYDDDAAASVTVGPGEAAFAVRAERSRTGAGGNARLVLREAGAAALLDVTAYEAQMRAPAGDAIVDATSAGDPTRSRPAA